MLFRRLIAPALLCVILTCSLVLATSHMALGQVPLSNHVVLVVEENTSFATAFSSSNPMPWLDGKARAYGYANNFVSDVGGSLLDYLYLASGSSESAFDCDGNDCFYPNPSGGDTTTKHQITSENIFHLMSTQPISWKVYAENYLNAGGTVNTPDRSLSNGTYYARHNAAVWYQYVLSNALGTQGQIVDFEQFGIDLANNALPRYSIIIPDGKYDRHDGTLAQADSFLQNNLTALLGSPDFQALGSGLLIITFDNGDLDHQGQVLTTFIGPNIKSGYVSNVFYRHENTLRTMLDSLGITTYPGLSSSAADMSDLFTSTAGGVAVDSPPNNSAQGTSVLVRASALELSSQIDHVEIWDNNAKLGNYASPIDQRMTFATGSHQMTVQDIGPGPNYAVLHKEVMNFTVSGNNGVVITTPAPGSIQSSFVPINGYAVEGGTPIDHLEVWADGTKLGDSPKGSTISQWFALSPNAAHTLTIQDMTSNAVVIHKSTVSITTSSNDGVYVNSPAAGIIVRPTFLVNAYSYEQNPFSVVDHMEVWDNTHGVKLSNSPTGTGVTSLYMNQNVTVNTAQYGYGNYQLAISDIDAATLKPIHSAYVTVNVQP
jgi:hypothetical protein